MRIGYGVDLLRLVYGLPLVLGGVEIPFEKGLDGPGQGDVLARAVVDAFLGGCALCDPGPGPVHEEIEGRGESALSMLRRAAARAEKRRYSVVNLDATILITRPRISRYLDKMRRNIAEALDTSPENISIKERSPEGLGPAGRGEGIEARAVLLLRDTGE